MNRKDRRKANAEEKKINDKKVAAVRWFHTLPPEKAQLVDSYARMIAEKHHDSFIGALDRAYTATLIKCFDHLEWHHIEKIIDEFDEFVREDVDKSKKLREECGGDVEMATKKINEQEQSVRDRVIQLVDEGKKQKEIIDILSIEFPQLSKSMLTNAYKKTKTMMVEAREMKECINKAQKLNEVVKNLGKPDVDTKEALEYIFSDSNDAKEETVVTADVKEETIIVPKIEVPEVTPEADFEIIKEVRILDIKGKHGTYHIEKNVVEVTDLDLAFDNEAAVADWADAARQDIWVEIEKLQNKLNSITEREMETVKVIKKFM